MYDYQAEKMSRILQHLLKKHEVTRTHRPVKKPSQQTSSSLSEEDTEIMDIVERVPDIYYYVISGQFGPVPSDPVTFKSSIKTAEQNYWSLSQHQRQAIVKSIYSHYIPALKKKFKCFWSSYLLLLNAQKSETSPIHDLPEDLQKYLAVSLLQENELDPIIFSFMPKIFFNTVFKNIREEKEKEAEIKFIENMKHYNTLFGLDKKHQYTPGNNRATKYFLAAGTCVTTTLAFLTGWPVAAGTATAFVFLDFLYGAEKVAEYCRKPPAEGQDNHAPRP